MSLYAFILPLATARGKIFDIKYQPVVKKYKYMATGNYFLI